MVGVEQASFRRTQALFCELQDLPDDAAPRRESADLVTDSQRVTRTRGLAVDAHVVGFESRLRERARLEQARSKQVAVEPHRLTQRFTDSASWSGDFTCCRT